MAILVSVPFAVELSLDPEADAAVRRLWERLDDAGVPSLGGGGAGPYRPHVSLAVFEEGDPARLWAELSDPVGSGVGLPLEFAGPGSFPTADGVVFLQVVPTGHLLAFHAQVIAAYSATPSRLRPYYDVGRFVPHCTLATGLDEGARAVAAEVLADATLPTVARVTSGALVEVPSGRVLFDRDGSG